MDKYAIYSCCNTGKVSSIIYGLLESGDPELQALANMLQWAMDNPLEYLGANCGLPALQKMFLDAMKKAGAPLFKAMTSIPIVGPILMGVKIGISIGTGINKALMNIDGIQKAAYDAEYAMAIAHIYYPSYLEAYSNFYTDPFDPAVFNAYQEAMTVFTELVALEYETYAKVPEAYNQSPLGKLFNWLEKKDPDAVFESIDNIAEHTRTKLKNAVSHFYSYIEWIE